MGGALGAGDVEQERHGERRRARGRARLARRRERRGHRRSAPRTGRQRQRQRGRRGHRMPAFQFISPSTSMPRRLTARRAAAIVRPSGGTHARGERRSHRLRLHGPRPQQRLAPGGPLPLAEAHAAAQGDLRPRPRRTSSARRPSSAGTSGRPTGAR